MGTRGRITSKVESEEEKQEMPYKGKWGYGPDGKWGYRSEYVSSSSSDFPRSANPSSREVGVIEAVISWLLSIAGVIFLIYQIANHH
jgi:hypothetical protein